MSARRSPLAPPRWLGWSLAIGPLVALALFFVWPLVAIGSRGLRWSAVRHVLADHGVARVAWFTLWQAAVSTAATFVVALPLTAAVSRFAFRGRRLVIALVGVPFVLPTVVVATAISATLPRSWDGTVRAIIVAHVFFNVAVVVRTVGAAWTQLDARYEDAARTLGASRVTAARTIALPLLRGPILAASAIVFLFTFTSFGVVRLLGGPRHPTLEVEIYRRAAQQVDLPAASALGLVQLVAVIAVLALWARAGRRRPPASALRNRPPATRARRPAERSFVFLATTVTMVALALPIARLVERSLAVPGGHGLAWYRSLSSAGRGTTRALRPLAAFRTSLTTAFISCVIATVVGALAALALTYTRRGRGRGLLGAGLMLPLGTSAVTIGLGLFVAFGQAPLDLRGSAIMVPLAHALIGIPFVVRALAPTLQAIDPRLHDAAATLGASRWQTFALIDVPLARRTLIVGAGMAFAVSLGEFGATSFLTRRSTPTVPIAIANLLARPGRGNVGQAQALAVLLAGVVTVVFVVTDRFAEAR